MSNIETEIENIKAKYKRIFTSIFTEISTRFNSDMEYKRWRKSVLFFFDVELKEKLQNLTDEIFKKKGNITAIVAVRVVDWQ